MKSDRAYVTHPVDPGVYDAVVDLGFAIVGLRASDTALCSVDFLPADTPVHRPLASSLAAEAVSQLSRYMTDPEFRFTLPLDLRGTPHQQRVWQVLLEIPAGQTRTYGAIAGEIGSSARAIGNACRANPCPLLVPCHRVVAQRGLGGFAGDAVEGWTALKRQLLQHEGAPGFTSLL